MVHTFDISEMEMSSYLENERFQQESYNSYKNVMAHTFNILSHSEKKRILTRIYCVPRSIELYFE